MTKQYIIHDLVDDIGLEPIRTDTNTLIIITV